MRRSPGTGSFGVSLRAAPSESNPGQQVIEVNTVNPTSFAHGILAPGELISHVNGNAQTNLASMLDAIAASQDTVRLTVSTPALPSSMSTVPPTQQIPGVVGSAGGPSLLTFNPTPQSPQHDARPIPNANADAVRGDARATPALPERPALARTSTVLEHPVDFGMTSTLNASVLSSEDPRNPQAQAQGFISSTLNASQMGADEGLGSRVAQAGLPVSGLRSVSAVAVSTPAPQHVAVPLTPATGPSPGPTILHYSTPAPSPAVASLSEAQAGRDINEGDRRSGWGAAAPNFQTPAFPQNSSSAIPGGIAFGPGAGEYNADRRAL